MKLSCPLVLGSQLQAANSVGRKRERKKGRCGGVGWERERKKEEKTKKNKS